jgi:hypothetical protein
MNDVLRQHAEQQFAHELEALKKADKRPTWWKTRKGC